MRYKGKFKDKISSEPIEGEPNHIEAISILCPSMPAIDVSSKSVLRGELMSISTTTMTYPNLMEELNCHEKESAPPKKDDFINKHVSYFLTIPSIPCSYEKFPKFICSSAITDKIYNPFLLPVNKNIERVIVDAFVYHKFCKFHSVMSFIDKSTEVGVGGETTSPT